MSTRKPKKPAPEKRIPVGTIVSWRTSPEKLTTLYKGTVIKFDPIYKAYAVEVALTPSGKLRSEPIIMRPPAKRLESQNPSKLRIVK